MKIEETRVVTEEKNVVSACKCDNCGKVLTKEEGFDTQHSHDGWHSFMSMHNHWGNDSIDSQESWDVCSPVCYFEMLTDIMDRQLRDRTSGDVDDMSLSFARRMVEFYKNIKL